jgi:uncharacterized protein
MKYARWIKLFLLVYALLGIGIFYLQDYFLFHPEKVGKKEKYQFGIPYKELNIPYDANSNLNIIQFSSTLKLDSSKGVVLYFHGNRKNIGWYAQYVPEFTQQGWEVWMIDYPGFGKSTGTIKEELLYSYASLVYKIAKKQYDKEKIIIYGKSMGTGIAAQLASLKDCKHLILETPYYSLKNLISHFLPFYPIGQMIRYQLPTHDYLPKVYAPVTIFQGDNDRIVPYSNAVKLKPLLKPTDQFISITNGKHNNLSSFPIYKTKLTEILNH